MNVNLYKLHYIHSFKSIRIAIYVKITHLYHNEILSDALDILNGANKLDKIVLKPNLYVLKENKNKLFELIRQLKRSRKLMESTDNVDKAIFMETTFKSHWIGTHKLYYNKYLDITKTDFPEFSGCTCIGTILIPKGIIKYD